MRNWWITGGNGFLGRHLQSQLASGPAVSLQCPLLFGKWQVVNRMYIVRKYRHRGLSLHKAWGASLLLLVSNSVRGILYRQSGSWDRGLGNMAGIVSELRGGSEQVGGFLK